MFKIGFINGSPRSKNSLSIHMIDYFCEALGVSHPVIVNAYKIASIQDSSSYYDALLSCEVIMVVSPLYVDALPSHVLSLLRDLECYNSSSITTTPTLYGFINCGFIEGTQNHIALDILENYAVRMNWQWGGGLGLGGGEMFKGTKDKIPKQAKIMKPVYEAFDTFIACINSQTSLPSPRKQLLVNQDFSKLAFIFMGSLSWIIESKRFLGLFHKPYAK